MLEVLRLIPRATPQLIESSCCGMAGAFGYEAAHQEISRQMAEASLLPAVRARPEAIVIADGASCRQQIFDGTQRESIHLVRLLDRVLPQASARGSFDPN
jgi:Fe-S oxidoreductase